MKFTARLRFIMGIIIVVLISFSLFIYLDYSMSRVDSINAQLLSDNFSVGIDYSGIIEKQYIDEGAYVKTGDPLFELRSPTMNDAIRNNDLAKSSLLYRLSDDGLIVITAAAAGRVKTIDYKQGAFVPANSQIALINIEGKLFIEATYKLSSPDYARINNNSKVQVVFPDNTKVIGQIYDISLSTVNKEVLTTVRARFDQDYINKSVFSVGTPVGTTLYFDSNTWLDTLNNGFNSLIKPNNN